MRGAQTMLIHRKSPVTGKINEMDLPVTAEQVLNYTHGELVQNAFPQLNAEQREFIISGCTPEDWKALYGDSDETKGD